MRTCLALLVAATAVAAPVPKALTKPPPKPDGAWEVVEFVHDGQDLSDRRGRVWVIAGEHIFPNVAVEPAHGDKGPPNFTTPDESRPRRRVWGTDAATFAVDGDTLRLCVAFDGRTELADCKPGKGVSYIVFERSK